MKHEEIVEEIDKLAKFIKDDLGFATLEQVRHLLRELNNVQYNFAVVTEENCVDVLENLGFECKKK